MLLQILIILTTAPQNLYNNIMIIIILIRLTQKCPMLHLSHLQSKEEV